MKMLQIIPGFPTGGAEKVVLTYLRHFKNDPENECFCISLTPNRGRIYETQIEEEKLPVYFMDDFGSTGNKLTQRIKQIRALRKLIRQINPDVVHIHLSIVWLVSLSVCGLHIKHLFHTLHSEPEKILAGRHRLINHFCYKMLKITPIALNAEQRKKAIQLLRGMHCEALGNGIDIEQFRQIQPAEARKKFGIGQEEFVIGSIGRLIDTKNYDFALEVVAAVAHQRNVRYFIVGDGALQPKLEEKAERLGISDRVVFLGSRSDIPEFLAAVDVFLFPSKWEGLGIVLLEAQAAGKNCVISDRIPAEAVATDQVIALPLDAPLEQWRDALLHFDLPRMRPEKALADYDTNQIIQELVRIYEK